MKGDLVMTKSIISNKVIAGIGVLAAAALIAAVPVKAETAGSPKFDAAIEREKAYLQSVNPDLLPAAEASLAAEEAMLDAIQAKTVAGAEVLDAQVNADYAREQAMLDAIEASTQAAALAALTETVNGLNREIAYLVSIKESTAAAAAARDAQAISGLQGGASYLNWINEQTITAQNVALSKNAAGAEKEINYLNAVNPALVPAAQHDLDVKKAWLTNVFSSTLASAAARDAQAAAGAEGGLTYLNWINERTAAAQSARAALIEAAANNETAFIQSIANGVIPKAEWAKGQAAGGFNGGYAYLQWIHASIGAN